MKLLVGLGNPGPKYEKTRHNAGFLVLDKLAQHFGISWNGEKFSGIYARGNISGEDCILLKPMTFMNLSGRSVQAAVRFFKIDCDDIVVLHDDIDVPSGKVKARIGGGHGGHNGILSIFKETGMKNFHRIKLGVGRPDVGSEYLVENWVLSKLRTEELEALEREMFEEVLLRLENSFK